jgi:hypothetical protein
LQVGIVGEELTVTDTPPLVQTDTSTLGQVISGRHVSELPLNERNFLTFALLVPGSQLPVSGSQNSTQGGAISVNGARKQANNSLLDGLDNNDLYINSTSSCPRSTPFRSLRCNPATTCPNSAAAAEPR